MNGDILYKDTEDYMENNFNKIERLKYIQSRKFNRKGTFAGLFSGFTFGMNIFILGLAVALIPEKYNKTVFVVPLVVATLNDIFASIWLTVVNIYQGKFKEIFRSFNTFPGKVIAIGALLGGPIANSGYLIGIALAGPSYAAPLTALYPAVGAILSFFILKQKIIPRVWLGLIISLAGSVLISYAKPDGNYPYFYLGIIAVIITAIGWGAEGVLGAYGSSILDPQVAITIRDIVSGIIFLVVVVPIVGGFSVIGGVLSNITITRYLIIGSGFAAMSYLAWYKANSTIGVAKGMAINITYVAWGVILSQIYAKQLPPQNLVIGALLILIGAVIVSIDPKEFFKREVK